MYALSLKNFGPQIRGGESSSIVHISDLPVGTQGDSINILSVFSWKDYARFNSEFLFKDGFIALIEENEKDEDCPIDKNIKRDFIRIPFTELSKKAVGTTKSKNIILMGILEGLFNISKEGLLTALQKRFKKKGDELVNQLTKAYEVGLDWAKENKELFKDVNLPELDVKKSGKKMVISGNDAAAFGALASGCTFFSGYPITPSSEVLEWASKQFPKFNGVFIQAEDAISSVGIATGASYAGEKVLLATSGPGISLMQETIGLASIAEIPLVIINVQRGGPSTGIPTKMEQSDLASAVFGGHGDSTRIVLAATDVRDCFYMMNKAYYFSEKYQIPVIVLSDQFIGGRLEAIDPIDLKKILKAERLLPKEDELGLGKYKRYDLNAENGISAMAIPGMEGGQHYISGLEHDEYGRPNSETSVHQEMSEKRYRKFEGIRKEAEFRNYGDKDSKIGIIGWGSTDGPIRETIMRMEKEGIKIKGLVPEMLYPVNYDKLNEFLNGLDKLFVAEISFSAQFYKLLKMNFNLPEKTVRIKRAGGVPFYVDEIYSRIKEEL
jgi:2-oxoglutarate ferredoxin oxidoreductase subunit alpha